MELALSDYNLFAFAVTFCYCIAKQIKRELEDIAQRAKLLCLIGAFRKKNVHLYILLIQLLTNYEPFLSSLLPFLESFLAPLL